MHLEFVLVTTISHFRHPRKGWTTPNLAQPFVHPFRTLCDNFRSGHQIDFTVLVSSVRIDLYTTESIGYTVPSLKLTL